MIRLGIRDAGHFRPSRLPRRSSSNVAAADQEKWPYEQVPGPKPLPLLGNAWRFAPIVGTYAKLDIGGLETTLYNQFGKIAKLSNLAARKDMVFLYDPHDVEKALRNEGTWPIRGSFKTIPYYRGVLRKDLFDGVEGAVFTQGKEWHDFRTKVNQPMMQPRSAKLYVTPIDEVASDFIQRLRDLRDEQQHLPNNMLEHFNRWALESIATVALDTRLGCLAADLTPNSEPQRLIDAVLFIFDTAFELDVKPSLRHFTKNKLWPKMVEALDCFTDVSMKYVQQAMDRIKNKVADGDRDHSILETLLLNNDKPMVACVMALDMMFAGIETTSISAAVALHYLAKNPINQEKLFQEIREILPSNDQPITGKDLEAMKYLKACIKESMRLTPVVTSNMREISKDLFLSNYRVPKGTDAVLCHMVMCRLEENFPQADRYIPERWLKGHDTNRSVHPFVFMPFGYGPRMCLGRRFAELETETLVAKVIRNFRLEINHELETQSRGMNKIVSPLSFRLEDRT